MIYEAAISSVKHGFYFFVEMIIKVSWSEDIIKNHFQISLFSLNIDLFNVRNIGAETHPTVTFTVYC